MSPCCIYKQNFKTFVLKIIHNNYNIRNVNKPRAYTGKILWYQIRYWSNVTSLVRKLPYTFSKIFLYDVQYLTNFSILFTNIFKYMNWLHEEISPIWFINKLIFYKKSQINTKGKIISERFCLV